MKNYKIIIALLVFTTLFSCVKEEYDTPPILTIPEGAVLTIGDIYQIYTDSIESGIHPGNYKFTEDLSLFAIVGMDDKTGNIYKSAYIQDDSLGINLHLLSSGGLYQGDSIRINLKGLILGDYKGMMQLDSVDVDKNIVKQATLISVPAIATTLSELNDVNNNQQFKAKLIKLENVSFSNPNQTWADAVNLASKDVILVDDMGSSIIIRSSGYASFAGDTLSKGVGTLYAIYTVYGTTPQLVIRTPNEVDFKEEAEGAYYLNKNYEDGSVTSGGWINEIVIGTDKWKYFEDATKSYARIFNDPNFSHQEADVWYISPTIALDTATNPILTFKNACDGSGSDLEVWVSTDYTGTFIGTNWTQLSFTLSAGSLAWTNSGNIDLSAYNTQEIHIAFRYTGSNTDGKVWQIDDIKIKEQ